MRKTFFALFLAAAVVFALAPQSFGSAQERERRRTTTTTATNTTTHTNTSDRDDLPEKDEFRQSYQLSGGTKVEVRGINGAVDIETAAGSTAEVNIIRSARSREDLEYRKIIVEHTAGSLVIRGDNERERSSYGRNRDVKQRVMLRLPRAVDLGVSGVNGRVGVGEIDGPVRLSGINGRVEVAQAMGYSDISGINGRVKITISQVGERGIHVSGVNGGVELFFAEDLNADLDVTGINGSVNTDVANVTVFGKLDRHNFHAKIGSGGSPIKVTGINGHVKLARAGSPG
ncbi:MAG TPA: hypothetical protein VI837_10925 [Blastocatellia bacterium]|nr:hypothetical protein [Blastocatellia bacterium]